MKEMQMKTAVKYDLMPFKIKQKTKKQINDHMKCWQACGDIGLLLNCLLGV